MLNMIGFDRKIEREWLDLAIDRLTPTTTVAEVREYLQDVLKTRMPAPLARRKTITVLVRIWAAVPEECLRMRDEALALLPLVSKRDRLWLHWGMTLLAYPIFRDITIAMGRLFKLQGDCTLGQLQRRILDSWGARSTLKWVPQRIVRSLVEWDVLRDAGTGRFVPSQKLSTESKELQLWLLAASHIAEQANELEWRHLVSHPSLFPFKIDVGLADLRRADAFAIHRQGLDMDMVAIRNRKQTGGAANVA